MTTQIATITPAEFIPRDVASSSKHIMATELLEFYPQSQETYSTENGKQIRITAASNNAFLDLRKSFFRFRVRSEVGSNSFYYRYGVHSLFRQIEVRARGPNTQIQRCDAYSLQTALLTDLFDTEVKYTTNGGEHVDWISNCGNLVLMDGNELTWQEGDIRAADAPFFTLNNGIITFPNIGATAKALEFRNELRPGSYVSFRTTNIGIPGPVSGRIVVRLGQSVYLQDSGANPNTLASISMTAVVVWYYQDGQPADMPDTFAPPASGANRWQIQRCEPKATHLPVIETDYEVTMRPRMSFFDQVIPLWLMQGGVEFIFELEQPQNAMCIAETLHGSVTPNGNSFTITQPRFYGHVMKPSATIFEEWTAQFRSGGFRFYLPTYSWSAVTLTDGVRAHVQINPAARSARCVYAFIQDNRYGYRTSSDLGVASRSDVLGTRQMGSVYEYQFHVGSQRFPLREVEVRFGMSRAFEQVQRVTGSKNLQTSLGMMTEHVHRHSGIFDTKKGLMCVRFDRDMSATGFLTGVDTTVLPIDFIMDRQVAYNTAGKGRTGLYTVHTFVLKDSLMVLSGNGLVILE